MLNKSIWFGLYLSVIWFGFISQVLADSSPNLLQNSNGENGVDNWQEDIPGRLNLGDDVNVRGIAAVRSSSSSSRTPLMGNFMLEIGGYGATIKVRQSVSVRNYSERLNSGAAMVQFAGSFRSIQTRQRVVLNSCDVIFQFKRRDDSIILQQKPDLPCTNLDDWTSFDTALPVPAETETIDLSIQLNGQADSYVGLLADDLSLTVDAPINSGADPGDQTDGTGLRGAVLDLTKAKLTCSNLTTRGPDTKIKLANVSNWNCRNNGFNATRGQKVRIVITGRIK